MNPNATLHLRKLLQLEADVAGMKPIATECCARLKSSQRCPTECCARLQRNDQCSPPSKNKFTSLKASRHCLSVVFKRLCSPFFLCLRRGPTSPVTFRWMMFSSSNESPHTQVLQSPLDDGDTDKTLTPSGRESVG